MQKDALNNVHITDEHVLMTPERTPVRPFRISSPVAIRACWWYVVLAPFTIRKLRLNMLVGLKPLPQRSAIASTW